jgi:hypothetical protein
MKTKVMTMIIATSLLVLTLLFIECVHQQVHKIEATPRQEHCTLVADTIVEYVHARRGLSCGTLADRENTANSIRETQVLCTMYSNMQCNYRFLMERIEAHVMSCTRCQTYIKCGE